MNPTGEIRAIGHRQLREELAPLLRELTEARAAAAVTNRNKVEAFLVPAPLYQELAQARDDLDQLRGLVPLLMAAVSAGAAIPSDALKRSGIHIEFDWKRVNLFQAAYPVHITHDEEGRNLPTTPPIMHHAIGESDEELDLKS